MNRKSLFAIALLVVTGFVVGAIAIAQEGKDAKSAKQSALTLPPGWTPEDLQAVMAAGAPGKMHELLAKDVGVWQGKNTMWMAPGAEPMKSESTSTIKPMMDGRFTQVEV